MTTWVVWRQDDNGNRFEVRRFAGYPEDAGGPGEDGPDTAREEAEALAAEMEARGHKQTYWVARHAD